MRLTYPVTDIFDPIRDGQALILDGQTLAHIEVLQNSSGTDEGTLFKLLCRCATPFGMSTMLVTLANFELMSLPSRQEIVQDMGLPAFA